MVLDILLINPAAKETQYGALGYFAATAPPVGLGMLAAFLLKNNCSVEILDAEAENISIDEIIKKIGEYNPAVVGITTMTPRMTVIGKLLKKISEAYPQIKTVLGGFHVSALPERTLREEAVDFVIVGEGFYPLLELVQTIKARSQDYHKIAGLYYRNSKEIINNSPRELIRDLDCLPMTAWDLLPMNKYRAYHWHCWEDINKRSPYALVFSSLGCPFSCNYCSVKTIYGRGIRYRSPEVFIKEIDYLVKRYNVKNMAIQDDTFIIKKERVIEICDLLIQRRYDLNLWCYSRVDMVDDTLLKKMRLAGIKWIAYGVETGNPQLLEKTFKHITLEKIRDAFRITRDNGIYIVGNYLFGLQGETQVTCMDTIRIAKELNAEYSNFNIVMPYPGSDLYEYAVKYNLPLPERWEDYGQFTKNALPFSERLNPRQIIKIRRKAVLIIYTNPRYINLIYKNFGLRLILNEFPKLFTDVMSSLKQRKGRISDEEIQNINN